ncbi:Phage tail protein [Rhodovastum atsumiense]|uniref:Phage tail protein n=1 Tax=Rhodovastum atsumiense TaxID=504468 RepID=A0A5M6IYP7_9PROT|nr:phage tail protein [Rhodovastum atsumiense]KAA5613470.1 phage tail protein [Rhodovastum atsumiense]CAH2603209.1 Phage tail protein [Rhodovastum atsumiense]
MIVQQGAINLAAVQVPGVIVQIVPPAISPILGVPSNGVAFVGTASWGPVNSPAIVGSYADYAAKFGPLKNRPFDMGTHVAAAYQQGANDFRCVRVTDGTDTVAVCVFNYEAGSPSTSSLALPSLYTGSYGNNTIVTLSPGTRAGSWKLTVSLPGMVPEVFDNVAAPTPAAFWSNLADAVNHGQGPNRGPSQIVFAQVGSRTAIAPAAGSTANGGSGSLTGMVGGTDGADGVTAASIVGSDGTGANRSGIYATRGCGTALLDPCDLTDTTHWANVAAFALAEGMYAVLAHPAGTAIGTAVAATAAANVDSYAVKVLHGDWCYWSDTVSAVTRAISPQGFVAGRLANLSPQHSGLNKPLAGIVGTQKTAANQVYAQADLLALRQAGIGVIVTPGPGGQRAYTLAFGCNAGSNTGTNGDNYSRLTNFLAPTLNQAMGSEIGRLQSGEQRRAALAKLDQFLASLWQQGIIGNASGDYPNGPQPWSLTLDDSNNPPDRVALGFEQIDLKVQYLSVILNLLVNLEAGQSVQITRAPVAA